MNLKDKVMRTEQGNIIEELEKIIKGRAGGNIRRDGNFVLAAVMIIIREEKGEHYMLFIKRLEKATDLFSGHIAFPGGKVEESDRDTLETAVRETFEETGIDLKKSGRIIGKLDDFNPVNPRANHYVVTPYVAFLHENVPLNPHEREVAEAFWVSLSHLIDERNSETRVLDKQGVKREDLVFYYLNYIIWGMTARILNQFLRLTSHLF